MGDVLDCVDSGWISSLGQYVARFERDFATFSEARHAVATSNGTTALHLCLATLGIGPGDEVLVPDLTFVSTANVVRYTGATPVLVDSDPRTWGMDAADARRKLTARTRAVIPVHLYGHPVDMDPFIAMAAEHGLDIVEDAAEAHGTRYKGRRVGALGRIGAFSFYGNKIITTGEGGMVVTNDPTLAERAAFLRDHAMDPRRRYYHPEIGFYPGAEPSVDQSRCGLEEQELPRRGLYVDYPPPHSRTTRDQRSMNIVERPLGGPEIEVVAKATRRRFTLEYRRKIVREADRCKTPRAVGALRRGRACTLPTCDLAYGARSRRVGGDGEEAGPSPADSRRTGQENRRARIGGRTMAHAR